MTRLVTIRQAMLWLPLSYETIRLMCIRGEIEGAKQVKGRWCIPESAPLFRPAPDPYALPANATPAERAANFSRMMRDPIGNVYVRNDARALPVHAAAVSNPVILRNPHIILILPLYPHACEVLRRMFYNDEIRGTDG